MLCDNARHGIHMLWCRHERLFSFNFHVANPVIPPSEEVYREEGRPGREYSSHRFWAFQGASDLSATKGL